MTVDNDFTPTVLCSVLQTRMTELRQNELVLFVTLLAPK